jgi:hypothetical protein
MKKHSRTDKLTYWQNQIKEWQDSGIKQTLFCRQNKLNFTQFTYWKRKFASSQSIPGQFVQVKTDQPGTRYPSSLSCEIILSDNIRICLKDGFDPESLKLLIRTVRESVC